MKISKNDPPANLSEMFLVRVTPMQKLIVERAAVKLGKHPSTWIRELAVRAAMETVKTTKTKKAVK